MTEAGPPDLPRRPGQDLVVSHERSKALALPDPASFGDDEDEGLDLREYWRTILKRRKLIVGIALVIVLGAFIATLLEVPMYRAATLLQIQDSGPRLLQFDDLDGEGRRGDAMFYNTQLQIILSTNLALEVVRALDIHDHPDFAIGAGQRGLLAQGRELLRVLSGQGVSRGTPVLIDRADPAALDWAQRRAAGILRSRLSAQQVGGSHLVRVSYVSFDPNFAAQVANEVARQYSRMDLERRFGAGSEARRQLQEQIAEMRVALDASDAALAEFSRQRGIANFESRLEQLNQTMSELNAQLRQVQLEKVRLDATRAQVDAGIVDRLDIVSEDEQIRALRAQLAAVNSEYAVLSGRFQDEFPALVELRARRQSLEEEIRATTRRIIDGLVSRHDGLLAQEQALIRALQQREEELLSLSQEAVEYNTLRRDFTTNRELYDGLLQRLKEIGVAEGVQRENVSVIEPATAPARPFSPDTRRQLTMAIVIGLALGVGLALLLEFLDRTVKTAEDLEKLARRPVLGVIPLVRIKRKGEEAARTAVLKQPERQVGHYSARHPKSAVSEAFRSLRTSLMFSTPEGMPKTILFTSPAPGDGKTTCAINLATVLAQNGARVLLLDADLRKPRVHRDFGKPLAPGLVNRLTEVQKSGKPSGAIGGTDVPGLFVMTAGSTPPNPAEMLGSARMAALIAGFAKVFDHVIIDSPPVIGLADALVLSRLVDGVILVTAAGVTGKDDAKMSIKRLRQVQAPVLGLILNAVDLESPSYAYYASYYYDYYGDEETDRGKVRSLPKTA